MATAVLVLHMQVGLVEHCGEVGTEVAERLVPALDAARGAGVPVIHVRLAYRPGLLDTKAANRTPGSFNAGLVDGEPGAETLESLRGAGDLYVTNKRASAFKGSDLAVLLRSLGIDHLVLTGVSSGGVVIATLMEAGDLDYQVTVLRDGCGDPRPGVHDMLVEHLFVLRGDVPTVADWTATLG